mmetsp:Transcript_16914/g.26033  ORF Transcript_16914/g.26033 Transcript_16914/m.26033 type:complete len:92 (-) Transcript_16914:428-703(-)
MRDLIRNVISNLKIADKFAEFEQHILTNVPRLTAVINASFCEGLLVKQFMQFNAESNCKVQYSVEQIVTQLNAFTCKVIKAKENGYRGYKF